MSNSPPPETHYSSSSSASSLTTLKNRNSYTPFEVDTTRSQSRSCCFLRNFFVLLRSWAILHVIQAQYNTHRYFRYRPENSWCATTSILPSPCCDITIVSPRLPVLPSTLIRSCRNFSNAETSKILSLAGWEALMINYCRYLVDAVE